MTPLAQPTSITPPRLGARATAEPKAPDSDSPGVTVEHLLAELEECRSQARRRHLLEEVVERSLDLADSVATRYRGRGIDTEDLVQIARLALVKAALRYRTEEGTNFSAYAVPTMSGEVKRYFRDSGWAVRPTRRLQEGRARIREARESLTHRHGREPTTPELARAAGVAVADVKEVEKCSSAFHALSLDLPPGGSGPALSQSLEAPGDHAERVVDHLALQTAVGRLGLPARRILYMSFVEERTQAEIGAVLGLSQMNVSRTLRRTLDRLRQDLLDDTRVA